MRWIILSFSWLSPFPTNRRPFHTIKNYFSNYFRKSNWNHSVDFWLESNIKMCEMTLIHTSITLTRADYFHFENRILQAHKMAQCNGLVCVCLYTLDYAQHSLAHTAREVALSCYWLNRTLINMRSFCIMPFPFSSQMQTPKWMWVCVCLLSSYTVHNNG